MNRITKGALCAGALGLSALLTLGQGLPAAAASPTLSGALAATALQSPQLGIFQQSSEGSSSNGQSSRDGQASPDGQSSAEAQVPSHGGAQPPGQVPSHGQGPSQGQDQSPFQQAPSQGQDPSQTQPGAQASSELDQEPASAEESTGIVLIETELGYQSAAAAGTGVLLDDSGTILTNNHVIANSTSITVTMADTGTSYEATVVGSDPTEDVAVLTIDPTSDLEPAEVADDDAAVGDAVTAVGNSEGGGVLQAADGTVMALDASLTTTAEEMTESESLSGMIEVDADIVSGDSGGALLDADGDVVGINTAASQGSANVTGYAIPIDRALDVAQDILDGVQTDTNTLGYPAFLGVALTSQQPSTPAYGSSLRERGEDQSSGSTAGGLDPNAGAGGSDEAGTGGTGTASTGATVGGVYEDTPAATIGLAAGDTITAVDGTQVADGEQLADLLDDYEPGDQASITWVDASGSSHSAEVTFAEGPAA